MTVAAAPSKLRRSALEAWAECPYHFFTHYVLGIDDTSDAALRGSAYHEAKRRYVLRLFERGLTTDAEEAQAALDEALVASTVPVRVLDDVEAVFHRMAANWELDVDAFLLAEETQDDDEFEWTPDAVYARDGELELEDDKTYWTVLTPDQVKRNFQALFYIWRAMTRWPNFPRYRFTFYFPRFNHRVSETWTADEMDAVERRVRLIVEQIKAARARWADLADAGEASATEAFPPTPGTHCALCRYRCPVADTDRIWPVRVTAAASASSRLGGAPQRPWRIGLVKWYQMDCNTPSSPTARRILRRLGRAGLGSYVLLLCWVGEHGQREPGRAVDAAGEPYNYEDLVDAAQCAEEEFDELIGICLETGAIDPPAWHERRELNFPEMARKADTYTRRVTSRLAAREELPAADNTTPEAPADESGVLVLFPLPPTDDQQAEQWRELWNALTTAPISKCMGLSETRRRHIKRRLREAPLEDWRDAIARIEMSAFCHGQNDRGWRASLDWLVGSPDVRLKVLEGKYDNRPAARAPVPAGRTGAAPAGKYRMDGQG